MHPPPLRDPTIAPEMSAAAITVVAGSVSIVLSFAVCYTAVAVNDRN